MTGTAKTAIILVTSLKSMAGPLALARHFISPRVLPVMPDGFQIAGQLRQRAEIGPALPLAVIIGAARGGEPEFARNAGEFEILLQRSSYGYDIDSCANAFPELRKKRVQLGLGK